MTETFMNVITKKDKLRKEKKNLWIRIFHSGLFWLHRNNLIIIGCICVCAWENQINLCIHKKRKINRCELGRKKREESLMRL